MPGYLGSELYDGPDGTNGGKCLWLRIPECLIDLDIIFGQENLRKFYQDEYGNGTQLHVDYDHDEYGSLATYKKLVNRLRKEFVNEYDVRFFPYNWLEDLNDSVTKLEEDIRVNHYDSVIFVTHSTGGLLASAFIAKSNANKLLVSKAILIAAPPFRDIRILAPNRERGCQENFKRPRQGLLD